MEISIDAEKPAVLVFGEVVNLSEKLYKEKTYKINEIIFDI